ncbi:MAG TPA: hypothetical protein VN577_19930 [Terriglobales bacterium]|nr:hypothetical protein [Terriglobales bacterium]
MKLWTSIAVLAVMWMAGCASPGAPQPPSLRIPAPVSDLAATRKGENVLLTWTPATQTSDGENIRQAGKTLVCRSLTQAAMVQCGTPVATQDTQVEHYTKEAMVSRQDATDTLPESAMTQNPTGFATYALEDQNPRGQSAGLSNQVRVPLAPTLPAPAGVEAKVVSEGVQLGWTDPNAIPRNAALSFLYRVFRRSEEGNKPEVIVGEVAIENAHPELLDRNIEWGQKYLYRIAPITRVEQTRGEAIEVEGDDSPIVMVEAVDRFAPEAPSGLQAVFSGPGQKPFVDLTWAPNLEADLAGYNVYRREGGAQAVKINAEVVPTPSFRDANVQPGREYFYSVAAVDARGNESAKSEETSEKVPQ